MGKIILVNKEIGISSGKVVGLTKKYLNEKKVGHCGTLDPLADGLLILLTGKSTKVARFLEAENKEYIATVAFGKSSITYDGEGPFSEPSQIIEHDIKDVKQILSSFLDEINQIPPIYSAIKKDGKKLYEYARSNKDVEIKPRKIHIYELELISYDINSLTFRCLCSKGTYIRSLGVDIATKLDNLGYLSKITRTKIGPFKLKDASTLEQIQNNEFKNISMYKALSNFRMHVLPKKEIELVKNGITTPLIFKGMYVIIDENKNVIAICENNKIIRGLF